METHAFGTGILDNENLCCSFENYFNLTREVGFRILDWWKPLSLCCCL